MTLDPLSLDPGIREAVRRLRDAQVETFESCEGGPGHTFRAFAAVFGKYGLRVKDLRRVWRVEDSELTGPRWELVFRPQHSPEGPTQ